VSIERERARERETDRASDRERDLDLRRKVTIDVVNLLLEALVKHLICLV
jgi:hypothetical protein